MQLDWKQICREAGFKPDGDEIIVCLDTGRRQAIRIEVHEEAFRLMSIVARAADVAQWDDAVLRAWQRNRAVALVGFRVDQKGRMVGETWAPKAGMTHEEFLVYAHTLAAECDRFEHQITGKDME